MQGDIIFFKRKAKKAKEWLNVLLCFGKKPPSAQSYTKKALIFLCDLCGFIKRFTTSFILILFSFHIVFAQSNDDTISLAGAWRFSMDSADIGIQQKFYEHALPGTIHLPGSMVQNNKGYPVTIHTQWTASIYDSSWYFDPVMAKYRQPDSLKFPFFLTPRKRYVDPAWYQKEIVIPAGWKNKHIILFLERVHWESKLWVDHREIGMRNSLSAPQVYDLTSILTPGRHTITLRIDNRIKSINPGPDSHSITDQTQGNWNGVVGKIALIATPEVWIQQIQTFPDLKDKSVNVKLYIHNNLDHTERGKINVSAKSFNLPAGRQGSPVRQKMEELTKNLTINEGDTILEINYPMGKDPLTWDEFHPALYHLAATLNTPAGKDTRKTDFGMRAFGIKGTRFTINGRTIFLRGTVENCDFPNTGYPPMDVKSWLHVFKVCKSYGLNEMRFHSYCPPEAAFEAADREGFYLHVEGPSWANHGSSLGDGKPIDQYLYDETNRIDRFYGNHPSFCMMAYGNEPRGGHQVEYLNKFVDYWKAKDPRHLYTGASVGMSWPWVKEEQFIVRSGPRGLPWADERPGTMFDHRKALEGHDIPYIAHEMGQYCAFPEFSQIPEYTGVHQPRNFELFRDILVSHHMGNEANKFLHASGELQALCYKGDIEAALRTPGMAGFELLGLNDYTGQGTALVGVLNVFWQSKGYVNAQQFHHFCGPVVPLARIPKFVYNNNEPFSASIEIANFSENTIYNAHPVWQLKNKEGKIVAHGFLPVHNIPIGNCIPLGTVHFPLNHFTKAEKLNFSVSLAGTSYENDWNIWVYPDKNITAKDSVLIYFCHELNDTAKAVLDKGGKVFLLCAGKVQMGKNISMHFLPVFWNTSWFRMRPPHTTGIYLNPRDPAFKYLPDRQAGFPTQDFSNFQWWSIVNKQQVMWLKDFPSGFRPIVQPIDTWFLDRRLGLIWDAKVSKGKLMVCSADITSNLKERPAARQLLYSLTKYMESKNFNPEYKVPMETIQQLFRKQSGGMEQ